MSGPGPAGAADERTVRVDPHLHTVASYDARAMPERLLARASEVGLDAVVVTDHDTVEGARIVADLAPDYGLVGIVGCEVSTADGHLLALGVDEAPEPGRPLPETARTVQADGGVAVVPHPFQRSRHGASAGAIDDVDGIEVYNAHALTNLRNRQAERFASVRAYPAFGGSDAHRTSGIGRAATAVRLAETAVSERAILDGMRAGRTAAIWRRFSRWQFLTKVVENAKRKTLSLL
ncbi:PHP domain-containing protein [Halomicroarcula sp. GCM10025709]|uniref:PHP domain-containing protein n=1 Tax=Haloarcula TaxID=2237 RepID=UPI0024C32D2F|nr:PHP domain-containing protein [Halomicroarcula sp. YJ-61-S]